MITHLCPLSISIVIVFYHDEHDDVDETADPYRRDEDSNIHLHLHLVAYRHRRPANTGERMMLSTAARSAERRTRDKIDRMINYIDYSILIVVYYTLWFYYGVLA